MRHVRSAVIGALLVIAGIGLATAIYVRATGLRGQPQPGRLETRVARAIRDLAIPGDVKARRNPLGESDEALRMGLEHYARYCALCHANDGSGLKTPLGQGLYPKPPDMRGEATQRLTDGELFYIIENGVRFTGMPAFGTGKEDPAGAAQVWQLVRFIRHLPQITADEIGWMQSLNPL
jgi:mono/diheme cytochrome c family protein